MKNYNNKIIEEIPIDSKQNSKVQVVFLKLLAKQKRPVDTFNKVRSLTYNSIDISNSINEVE